MFDIIIILICILVCISRDAIFQKNKYLFLSLTLFLSVFPSLYLCPSLSCFLSLPLSFFDRDGKFASSTHFPFLPTSNRTSLLPNQVSAGNKLGTTFFKLLCQYVMSEMVTFFKDCLPLSISLLPWLEYRYGIGELASTMQIKAIIGS